MSNLDSVLRTGWRGAWHHICLSVSPLLSAFQADPLPTPLPSPLLSSGGPLLPAPSPSSVSRPVCPLSPTLPALALPPALLFSSWLAPSGAGPKLPSPLEGELPRVRVRVLPTPPLALIAIPLHPDSKPESPGEPEASLVLSLPFLPWGLWPWAPTSLGAAGWKCREDCRDCRPSASACPRFWQGTLGQRVLCPSKLARICDAIRDPGLPQVSSHLCQAPRRLYSCLGAPLFLVVLCGFQFCMPLSTLPNYIYGAHHDLTPL